MAGRIRVLVCIHFDEANTDGVALHIQAFVFLLVVFFLNRLRKNIFVGESRFNFAWINSYLMYLMTKKN